MDRRDFLLTGLAAGAATFAAGALPAAPRARRQGRRFHLKYAPHFGMFQHHAGDDVVAQLDFLADEGFEALEDNWMANRPPEEQERIAAHMQQRGLEMGVFVAHAVMNEPTFVDNTDAARERIAKDMTRAVEVGKRVNAKWCTVVPGAYRQRVEMGFQTANVIDNLRRACEICEKSGLVMVLESLNPWRDHPGLFLSKIPQAYAIARAVDHPCCKLLDDLYHQQITEGNLIPNMDAAWGEIGYFQIGDNPGRNEPGTGEINYRNVFRHIHEKGYQGLLGMEHGLSRGGKEGERALIDAYVAADSFGD